MLCLLKVNLVFLYSSSSPFSFLLWWDNFFSLVSKVPFGTQKVPGKEKKFVRKMVSHVWFHSGKHIRKSNKVKFFKILHIFKYLGPNII